MKFPATLTLGLLAAALAGCASQRTSMGAGPAVVAQPAPVVATTTVVPATPRLAAADLQFIAVAAGSGMYEVEAARLALTRAANPQVRAFAQMLADHHAAGNNELMALVSSKGQRVAPGLPPALQQKVNTLSGLSGEAFDREFIRTTGVQDHLAAVAAFEQGRRSVADRDLAAFIDKTLPVLRSHLQEAQNLAGRMAG